MSDHNPSGHDSSIPEQIAESAATLPERPADPLTQAEARITQLEAELQVARVRAPIAERHGLNPRVGRWLNGDTEAELDADAKRLAEQIRELTPTTPTRPTRRRTR